MKYCFFFLCIWMCTACQGQPKGGQPAASVTPVFQQPVVPSMITDPVERAEYLVKHYWDHFSFEDTASIRVPEQTEQALVDYIDALKYASLETADASITDMMQKAGSSLPMLTHFFGLYEKYLYDPLSPFRNDEFFIPVLRAFIANPLLEEADKIRPAYLLEQAQKNRIGHAATDFTYTRADGDKGTLYGLKADWLLLFFYNPDCHSCADMTAQLSGDPRIDQLVREKKLRVLAVYPDAELSLWKNHLAEMPSTWINAYNQQLKENELYDLKAIPTLYLLDKNKKVFLKDVNFPQLRNFVYEAIN